MEASPLFITLEVWSQVGEVFVREDEIPSMRLEMTGALWQGAKSKTATIKTAALIDIAHRCAAAKKFKKTPFGQKSIAKPPKWVVDNKHFPLEVVELVVSMESTVKLIYHCKR